MLNVTRKCWICGNDGTTGEHKTKRSDLRAVFGSPTQADPLYYHDGRIKNRRVGSLDAKILKSPSLICQNCNTARTQPHDRAWEKLSAALRSHRPAITPGMTVRANSIFQYDTAREMLNVHLYFVKLFGCHIVACNIPIDINAFSRSILKEKAQPCVYLKFGHSNNATTGSSDVWAAVPSPHDSAAFITWFYYIDRLVINVMFALDGEKRLGLLGAWHPRSGSKKLVIVGFRFGGEVA